MTASKLTQDDAQEWLESLQQVGEGWYRQVALAVRANAHKALGMERREFAQAIGQKMIDPRPAILELHREGHGQKAIAEILGVWDRTVNRVLAEEGLVTLQPALTVANAPNEAEEPSEAEALVPISSDEDETTVANAPVIEATTTDEAALAERIESLSDDLAERVRSGDTSIDEAEQVSAEREERVSKYVREVRDALDILSRMVGHPVPDELQEALTDAERQLLSDLLSGVKGAQLVSA